MTFDGRAAVAQTIQSGTFNGAVPAVNTVYSQAITFPVEFKGTPHVVISHGNGDPSTTFVSATGVSAAGFTANWRRTVASVAPVTWIAVGPA